MPENYADGNGTVAVYRLTRVTKKGNGNSSRVVLERYSANPRNLDIVLEEHPYKTYEGGDVHDVAAQIAKQEKGTVESLDTIITLNYTSLQNGNITKPVDDSSMESFENVYNNVINAE